MILPFVYLLFALWELKNLLRSIEIEMEREIVSVELKSNQDANLGVSDLLKYMLF